MKLRLITQYYKSENSQRQTELENTLKQNIHLFDEIVLLCTDTPDVSFLISNPKIETVTIETKASYQDMFLNCGVGDTVNIIANSDIQFNPSINAAKYLPDNECWALSRWEGKNLYNVPYSQDVWIFKGKPNISCPAITMGTLGCDNRIAWEIQEANYQIKNPAKTIVTQHNHKSNYRTYDKSERIPKPYLHIYPHHIWEEPNTETIKENTLKDVSLICIDCVDPEKAVEALRSKKDLPFAKTILFSHEKPKNLTSDIEFIKIHKIESTKAYNDFTLLKLADFIKTEFCLSIQTDGYILNPNLWKNEFLNYDYVGAAWIKRNWNGKNRVGNSGFCLRSRRLLEATSKWGKVKLKEYEDKLGYWQDDIITCCSAYDDLIKQGISFAPISVASQFSFEQPIDNIEVDLSKVFGFHGRLTEQTMKLCL